MYLLHRKHERVKCWILVLCDVLRYAFIHKVTSPVQEKRLRWGLEKNGVIYECEAVLNMNPQGKFILQSKPI